jgi:hypothetical protein
MICEFRGRDYECMIAELRFIEESGLNESAFESLVERCSISFTEIPHSSMSEMSVELLHAILSHSSLQLPSEDWLYDFVKCQVTRNKCYSILFELIRYEYSSNDSIQDFTRMICQPFSFLTDPL